jgi:hypothetical protein
VIEAMVLNCPKVETAKLGKREKKSNEGTFNGIGMQKKKRGGYPRDADQEKVSSRDRRHESKRSFQQQ